MLDPDAPSARFPRYRSHGPSRHWAGRILGRNDKLVPGGWPRYGRLPDVAARRSLILHPSTHKGEGFTKLSTKDDASRENPFLPARRIGTGRVLDNRTEQIGLSKVTNVGQSQITNVGKEQRITVGETIHAESGKLYRLIAQEKYEGEAKVWEIRRQMTQNSTPFVRMGGA